MVKKKTIKKISKAAKTPKKDNPQITMDLGRASWEELEEWFQKGKLPAKLNGFYRGKLLLTRLNPVTDFFTGIFRKRLMPWKGKYFNARKKQGINIVSKKAAFLFRFQHPTHQMKSNGRTIEVFPFKTSQGSSRTSQKKKVFLINYDKAKNPEGVRKVVDELVNLGSGIFLGRAQIASGQNTKTVAYFTLRKE